MLVVPIDLAREDLGTDVGVQTYSPAAPFGSSSSTDRVMVVTY